MVLPVLLPPIQPKTVVSGSNNFDHSPDLYVADEPPLFLSLTFRGQTPPTSRFSCGLTMASPNVSERRLASRRVAFPREHRHRKSGGNDAVFVVFLRGWRTLFEVAPHRFVNRRSRVQISKAAPRKSRTIPQRSTLRRRTREGLVGADCKVVASQWPHVQPNERYACAGAFVEWRFGRLDVQHMRHPELALQAQTAGSPPQRRESSSSQSLRCANWRGVTRGDASSCGCVGRMRVARCVAGGRT